MTWNRRWIQNLNKLFILLILNHHLLILLSRRRAWWELLLFWFLIVAGAWQQRLVPECLVVEPVALRLEGRGLLYYLDAKVFDSLLLQAFDLGHVLCNSIEANIRFILARPRKVELLLTSGGFSVLFSNLLICLHFYFASLLFECPVLKVF